jgi:hypothetical protein
MKDKTKKWLFGLSIVAALVVIAWLFGVLPSAEIYHDEEWDPLHSVDCKLATVEFDLAWPRQQLEGEHCYVVNTRDDSYRYCDVGEDRYDIKDYGFKAGEIDYVIVGTHDESKMGGPPAFGAGYKFRDNVLYACISGSNMDYLTATYSVSGFVLFENPALVTPDDGDGDGDGDGGGDGSGTGGTGDGDDDTTGSGGGAVGVVDELGGVPLGIWFLGTAFLALAAGIVMLMNKAPVAVPVIAILLALGLGGYGATQLALFEDAFIIPIWGKIHCREEQVDRQEVIHVEESGQTVWCGKVSATTGDVTDSCKVYIEDSTAAWWSGDIHVEYTICDWDGSNCGPEQEVLVEEGYVHYLVTMLDQDKSVWITCERDLGVNTECDMMKEWRRYVLVDDFGGWDVINEDNCKLPVSESSKMLLGTFKDEFAKDEWVNRMVDKTYGPGTGVVKDQCGVTGEAYCSGNTLYTIVELDMETGQWKIEPDHAGTMPDGTGVSGLGTVIKQVACCPHIANCDADCEVSADPDDCSSDADCLGGGNPVKFTSRSYRVQTCESGACEWGAEVQVDCADDGACPAGEVCDLAVGSDTRWQCKTPSPGGYCGDGVCRVGESEINCPEDCEYVTLGDYGWYILGGFAMLAAAVIGTGVVIKKGGKKG